MMCIGLGWTHLTDAQIGLIGGFMEALLAVFVESNTVSKARMAERIDEKVDQKVAQKMSESSITLTVPNAS